MAQNGNMKPSPLLKKPRNLELLLHIARHEGICALDLERAGFSKPGVYVLIANLLDAGLIKPELGITKTEWGDRLKRGYFLTEKGKQAASKLLDLEKIVSGRFERRDVVE
jgi:hypothetical protein